jgi:serine protease Do
MKHRWSQRLARAPWLAGSLAAATVALSALLIESSPDAHSASAADVVDGGRASFADVIESVSPAVVNIAVTSMAASVPMTGLPRFRPPRGSGSPLDEFFGRFFDTPGGPAMPEPRRSEGVGSGFVVDSSGYVVTNNHVIDGAEKIVVTFQDGRKLDATLVGRDPKTDLALLKVNASEPLPHVELGDSDRARVGDWVIAIGNPFGLGGSATAGIISARGRDIQSGPYDDYLQIDAPINSGNSGGPVFSDAGEVIGVNTAIFSPTGGNVGIGFAIPANQAKSVIAALKENGVVERGWLGVQIQNLDPDLAQSLGVPSAEGALVAQVVGDGPAARAGLQAGDVITRLDGRSIDSVKTLSRAVAEANPDQTVTMEVWRQGRAREVRVALGNAAAGEKPLAAARGGGATGSSTLGLTLQALTDQQRSELGMPAETDGVLVVRVEPGSAAAEKGIRPGDVITQIDRDDVESVAGAVAALEEARERRASALLLVRTGDAQRFVALSFS